MKPPCCSVWLSNGATSRIEHRVALHHYETLKDMLDRGEKGLVELDSCFAGGKTLLRMEHVQEIGYYPETYWEAHEASESNEGWTR